MAEEVTEATDSLSKQTGGIVGLHGPLDSLDLTNILTKEFEEQEQGYAEPSSIGGVVEKAANKSPAPQPFYDLASSA